ncbi:LapA family protein [Crassaminicella profunda]|uniref:LapA family protein n=1 Tax=Crassaminicella profunda TaxID=1286698 RepID=UPI001CA6242A|nr:LapA family protein [Crassaminicella profunda]QZY54900.1 LapA family protein [Crassaminicella profunda]
MELRFVLSLAFAVIVALFAILNSSVVSINFLFAKFNVSQALVILLSAILGAVIVMLLSAVKQFKLKWKIKELTKTISRLEEENASYKEKEVTSTVNETLESLVPSNIDLDKKISN